MVMKFATSLPVGAKSVQLLRITVPVPCSSPMYAFTVQHDLFHAHLPSLWRLGRLADGQLSGLPSHSTSNPLRRMFGMLQVSLVHVFWKGISSYPRVPPANRPATLPHTRADSSSSIIRQDTFAMSSKFAFATALA